MLTAVADAAIKIPKNYKNGYEGRHKQHTASEKQTTKTETFLWYVILLSTF